MVKTMEEDYLVRMEEMITRMQEEDYLERLIWMKVNMSKPHSFLLLRKYKRMVFE